MWEVQLAGDVQALTWAENQPLCWLVVVGPLKSPKPARHAGLSKLCKSRELHAAGHLQGDTWGVHSLLLRPLRPEQLAPRELALRLLATRSSMLASMPAQCPTAGMHPENQGASLAVLRLHQSLLWRAPCSAESESVCQIAGSQSPNLLLAHGCPRAELLSCSSCEIEDISWGSAFPPVSQHGRKH